MPVISATEREMLVSSHSKKIFVSGCFDLLHSGHIRFLQQAAEFGDLHVSIGSDESIRQLKGREPFCSQQERLFMVQALRCVKAATIGSGLGRFDFVEDLKVLMPDVFVVNDDGDHPQKRGLCEQFGMEYKVLTREPFPGLPARSTTTLSKNRAIPYRIDLAGGWLDQPFVSKLSPGPMVVASVLPSQTYEHRSGMATSTRETAKRLWGNQTPTEHLEEQAKILFACENPPGKSEISGSQDALGILLPGVNRLEYNGEYWPTQIDSIHDEETISWLESVIYLKSLGPRPDGVSILEKTRITLPLAKNLAQTAQACWNAVQRHSTSGLGTAVTSSFHAQIAMFPNMVTPKIEAEIAKLPSTVLGYKLAGAGGGGYLIIVSETPLDDLVRIRIRRSGG